MAFHRGYDRELMARPSNLEATHSPKFFDPLRRGSASRSIRANFLLERAIDLRVAVVRILRRRLRNVHLRARRRVDETFLRM